MALNDQNTEDRNLTKIGYGCLQHRDTEELIGYQHFLDTMANLKRGTTDSRRRGDFYCHIKIVKE
ncbi:hypothetical protein N431DRAFT_467040 [Stipitochalara longipes BDJ]|nr:hypothetical protein N431DRAFT_467040 [Stipitochalara longipes BDJ]